MLLKKLEEVKENNLCTRCGTCVAICPENAIDLDEEGYPVVNANCTNCGLCLKTCPGWEVDFPSLSQEVFGKVSRDKPLEGIYKDVYLACAKDKEIRDRGSGGGLVTQLLIYLLRKKEIQGAIVVAMEEEAPWKARAILAESEEQILNSIQSKYKVVPVNSVLKELKEKKGKFALVSLPCQVQGFRKLCLLKKEWKDKISLVIGLYCHLNLEEEATLSLIKTNHIPLENIEHLEYRGGAWPGRIRAFCKDGSNCYLHQFDIKDGALNYLKEIFSAPRCFYCLDPANELADISVADAWIRDEKGEWLFKGSLGWSIVLERTEIGQKFLGQAIKDDAILIKRLPKDLIFSAHTRMIAEKKRDVFLKLDKLRRQEKPYPQYHLHIPPFRFQDAWKEKLFSFKFILLKFKFIRQLFTDFAFSPLGAFFAKIKIDWKRKKHKNKY